MFEIGPSVLLSTLTRLRQLCFGIKSHDAQAPQRSVQHAPTPDLKGRRRVRILQQGSKSKIAILGADMMVWLVRLPSSKAVNFHMHGPSVWDCAPCRGPTLSLRLSGDTKNLNIFIYSFIVEPNSVVMDFGCSYATTARHT